MANKCGKTVKHANAYEVWKGRGWTWLVLKKYQAPEKEKANPYARWLCAVQSPMTYGGFEVGDTYITDITPYAVKLDNDEADAYLKKEFGPTGGITKVE